MAFSKITNTQLNSRGATTLPNQPTISATALKQEFDAPAKNIVAPAFNNLIDELEATTAAADLGAVAPVGREGVTVQGVLNDISSDLATAESNIDDLLADEHTHANKALLDTYEQTEEDLADAVLKRHTHLNKQNLDKIGEDANGRPLYDEKDIGGSVNDAFKIIKVGATDIESSGEDTIQLVEGAGITLTPDADAKTVTIESTGGGGGGGGDMTKANYANNQLNPKTVDRAITLFDGTNTLTTIDKLNKAAQLMNTYVPVGTSSDRPITGQGVADALTNYYTRSEIDSQEQPLVRNAGSKTWTDLITNAATYLDEPNANKFYRLTTAGTVDTTNEHLFVAGIVDGEHFSIDSHIAVVEESAGVYKYDYFGGGIEPEVYFDASGTSLTYTFTHDAITTDSVIIPYSSIVGDKYTDITVASHTCTVTFAKSVSRTVRIYVK